MRAFPCFFLSFVLCGVLSAQVVDDWDIYFRGDSNLDGSVNISDPIHISNYLYMGGPAPLCLNQADANNDGTVNGADIAYLTNYLFGGGPAPPTPGDGTFCARDDEPYPGCNVSPCP